MRGPRHSHPMFPEANAFGVKICGVTSRRQTEEIIALGADAIGLNFWPKSKRFLPPAEAEWSKALRTHTCLVGVTVNATDEELDAITSRGLVDIIQLHGDETPERTAELIERGLVVIKALQVRDQTSLDQVSDYPTEAILLDAYNPGLYGGVGHTFPWELALQAQHRFPDKRFILSGGLNSDNVLTAVEQTQPAAVDVASGVESEPGIKNLEQVQRFIEQAREGKRGGA